MADKLEFRGKLNDILQLANEQGGQMTMDEVEKYFADDQLSEEQVGLVCDYLLSQKVSVLGYEKKGGVIREAHVEEPVKMSQQEQAYVEEYLREIGEMVPATERETQLAHYLPLVVEEAVKLYHPEVLIGDLIQEGNVSLMIALEKCEVGKEIEATVMESVRSGMLAMIEAQTETRQRDKKMVEKVSALDETLNSLKEELGRKVSVEELAERMNLSEAEIEDILKLAGEEVGEE